METPEIKKRTGISPIWILPVIAVLIGGWLIYTGYRDAGIEIRVHFNSAEGITPGKTKVMFKGIPFGEVRDIAVDPSLESVSLIIEMDKKVKNGLVEDLKLWIVRPEFSAGKIKALGTVLSGSYIEVQRGVSKIPAREFTGLSEPPPIPASMAGLRIRLTAEKLGSIQRDSQIYFKNIIIGSVQGYELQNDDTIMIDAFIKPEYSQLVTTETRFWNSSGVTFSGGLSGFKVHMESMATLIYGGISMYTPDSRLQSPLAEDEHLFVLYDDFDAAEYGITITLNMPSTMGLKVGSKVVYRGFEAGTVTHFTFAKDFDKDNDFNVIAHILLDPQADFIMKKGTKFWVVQPQFSLTKMENLGGLLKGSQISFQPGKGEFSNDFNVMEPPGRKEILRPGQSYTLMTRDFSSLYTGAPVLYRKLQVGEVTAYDLNQDGNGILATIFIEKKYTHLLTTASRFYDVSGISVEGSLSGISLRTNSLMSIVAGGVAFFNPADGEPPEENYQYVLYESYKRALEIDKTKVVIRFSRPNGLKKGAEIRYQGISVGEVQEVSFGPGMTSIIAEALIDRDSETLFREDTLAWLVTPEFSLSRVEGLDTVIFGPYITLAPGAGSSSFDIAALNDPPANLKGESGLNIILETDRLGSLKRGSPVYFRQVKIGQVTGYELSQNSQKVRVYTNIKKPYDALVRENTRFWNASGIKVDASLLSGVKIDTESLEAIVGGGVSMATPETEEAMGGAVSDDHHFILHQDAKENWLHWNPVIELVQQRE